MLAGEDLCGDQRQCLADPDLDGPDCHAIAEVLEAEGHVGLVAFQFSGFIAAAVIRVPRSVELVELSL